jgi:HSP20 family protein
MAITRWNPLREIERWEPLRWEPFREIEAMQREMNRVFEQLAPTIETDLSELGYLPTAEMRETEDTVYLKLEVPGLEPKDIDIEVTEESISIGGERKTELKEEAEGRVRSEFRYGKFMRRIPLPGRIQSENVKAEYKNGILHLTLPKAVEEKRKHVKVHVVE